MLVNATRTLHGYISDHQQLTSPPLVTIAPGGTASAMLEHSSNNGQPCYADGVGALEVTPPDTTHTVSLASGWRVGRQGICSNFEINPVVAGTILDR